MFDNMKLGTRIWVGFGSILGICALLGGTAVVSMSIVKSDATKLSEEYVPEVSVANEVERHSLETMYQIRGYAFTYEPSFLADGKKNLAQVAESLKKADELAQKSAHLVKLKEQVKAANAAVAEYTTLLGDSEKEINEMLAARVKLDKSAHEFLVGINGFIEDQYKKMNSDINDAAGRTKLHERLLKIEVANAIVDFGNESRVAAQKAQALRDPKIAQETMPNFEKIEQAVAKLEPITRTAENKKQLAQARDAAREYKKGMTEFLSSWATLNETSAKRGKAADAVIEAAQTTATAGIKTTEEISKSAASSLGTISYILIVGLIGALLLGAFIAFTVSTSIGSILSRISAALGLASRQVRDAAAQMSSASQQLASSSAEQASSIEETTASIEEMAGMVSNNVEAAARASELSQKVSGLTEQGNETMKNLQGSMKEILVSNEQIEQLVKVIAAIGEKTKVMDEIVFQTKLLSFNASVEAERAGEHGRGFAVVAQEVGNLAQMSGKAAQEISHILSESIVKAETITTENKRKVEGGGHLVSETASALKEIAESAGSVTSGANQVLGASKEQASGIKQVNVAMTTLEKATQENSALAEEVASTSEEMASQCQGLDGIVAELTRLVHGKDQAEVTSTLAPSNAKQYHGAHSSSHGGAHASNHTAGAKKPSSLLKKQATEDIQTPSANVDGWEKL